MDRFNVGSLELGVNDSLIEESCGQHDLLTIKGTTYHGLAEHNGKAASMHILNGSNSRVFVGYLDTAGSTTGYKREAVTAGYILGASSVMRSGSERQWKDVRPYDIVCDVVQPYGFCLEMDTYEWTIPLFVQHNESDWQLLARLASEIGMHLIGSSVVIRIVDPIREIRRRKQRPILIADIKAMISYRNSTSPVPLGAEGRVFSGIDRFGETFTVVANEDSPIMLPAPETVNSLGDALNAAARIERRNHRLRSAECTMNYNPLLRSGSVIGLTNRSQTMMWYIAETAHNRSRKKSTTSLVLSRDLDDQRPLRDDFTQRWPTPILRQGKWVASTTWEREM